MNHQSSYKQTISKKLYWISDTLSRKTQKSLLTWGPNNNICMNINRCKDFLRVVLYFIFAKQSSSWISTVCISTRISTLLLKIHFVLWKHCLPILNHYGMRFYSWLKCECNCIFLIHLRGLLIFVNNFKMKFSYT